MALSSCRYSIYSESPPASMIISSNDISKQIKPRNACCRFDGHMCNFCICQFIFTFLSNFLEKSTSASNEAIISPPAFESLAKSCLGIEPWSENIKRLSKSAFTLNSLSKIIVVKRALSLFGMPKRNNGACIPSWV